MQKTLTITNDIGELGVMNRFLEEAGAAYGWNEAVTMSLNLVMEEAVSNVIFYAYEQGEKGKTIDISVAYEAPQLTVTVSDTGRLFDPTLRKDPDISLPADERPVGGLGIFLIKRIMDEVLYRREGNRNVLVMKKKIDGTNQSV